MLLQIIVVMVVTTYLLLALHLNNNDIPERELNLSHYGRTIVPYSTSGNSDLALNLTKNLNIFLKSKNQNLRKIRGKICLFSKRINYYSIKTYLSLAMDIIMVFNYLFLSHPTSYQYLRGS
jgi:hypothetical protein